MPSRLKLLLLVAAATVVLTACLTSIQSQPSPIGPAYTVIPSGSGAGSAANLNWSGQANTTLAPQTKSTERQNCHAPLVNSPPSSQDHLTSLVCAPVLRSDTHSPTLTVGSTDTVDPLPRDKSCAAVVTEKKGDLKEAVETKVKFELGKMSFSLSTGSTFLSWIVVLTIVTLVVFQVVKPEKEPEKSTLRKWLPWVFAGLLFLALLWQVFRVAPEQEAALSKYQKDVAIKAAFAAQSAVEHQTIVDRLPTTTLAPEVEHRPSESDARIIDLEARLRTLEFANLTVTNRIETSSTDTPALVLGIISVTLLGAGTLMVLGWLAWARNGLRSKLPPPPTDSPPTSDDGPPPHRKSTGAVLRAIYELESELRLLSRQLVDRMGHPEKYDPLDATDLLESLITLRWRLDEGSEQNGPPTGRAPSVLKASLTPEQLKELDMHVNQLLSELRGRPIGNAEWQQKVTGRIERVIDCVNNLSA